MTVYVGDQLLGPVWPRNFLWRRGGVSNAAVHWSPSVPNCLVFLTLFKRLLTSPLIFDKHVADFTKWLLNFFWLLPLSESPPRTRPEFSSSHPWALLYQLSSSSYLDIFVNLTFVSLWMSHFKSFQSEKVLAKKKLTRSESHHHHEVPSPLTASSSLLQI